MLPDCEIFPIVIRHTAAVSATTTIKPHLAFPTVFHSATVNGEIVGVTMGETTAITGDNTNRYDIQLCRGTVAAPINAGFHRFILAADLAANVPIAMTIDGAGQSGSTTMNQGGTLTKTGTALTVTSAATFPQTGKFYILIEQELMLVTAGAGTTSWNVTRGVGGTTASAHADSGTITLYFTSDSRRVTNGDVLHVIATKNGSASNLDADFTVVVWVANRYQYGAQTYAQ